MVVREEVEREPGKSCVHLPHKDTVKGAKDSSLEDIQSISFTRDRKYLT